MNTQQIEHPKNCTKCKKYKLNFGMPYCLKHKEAIPTNQTDIRLVTCQDFKPKNTIWLKIFFGEDNEDHPTTVRFDSEMETEAYLRGIDDGFGWTSGIGVEDSNVARFIGRGAS